MSAGTGGPWSGRRLHFVGVGGAGMSGYARAAHALGASVSGSDQAPSPYSLTLAQDGVLDAAIGHRGENLPEGADVEVVFSAAIPAENPERLAAEARGLALRIARGAAGRAQRAAAHDRRRRRARQDDDRRHDRDGPARGGLDPGYLIGGILRDSGRNGDWGSGEWLVVEADESDRSLLSLTPRSRC